MVFRVRFSSRSNNSAGGSRYASATAENATAQCAIPGSQRCGRVEKPLSPSIPAVLNTLVQGFPAGAELGISKRKFRNFGFYFSKCEFRKCLSKVVAVPSSPDFSLFDGIALPATYNIATHLRPALQNSFWKTTLLLCSFATYRWGVRDIYIKPQQQDFCLFGDLWLMGRQIQISRVISPDFDVWIHPQGPETHLSVWYTEMSARFAMGRIASDTRCFGGYKVASRYGGDYRQKLGTAIKLANYLKQFACNHSKCTTLTFVSWTRYVIMVCLYCVANEPGNHGDIVTFGRKRCWICHIIWLWDLLRVTRLGKRASREFANPLGRSYYIAIVRQLLSIPLAWRHLELRRTYAALCPSVEKNFIGKFLRLVRDCSSFPRLYCSICAKWPSRA